MSAAVGYDQLAELAEQELELIAGRRFDELAEVHCARAALIAELPARPPANARSALERAALINKRVEVEIARVREDMLLELSQIERAKRAARGYEPRSRQRRRRVSADA